MNIARRSLLKFVGGAAAGTFLTPMPWKLVSDSALWSQNWSWIPKLPRGEAKVKYTTCSLCPAACGMEVRCTGDQPTSLVGIKGHPLSRGTLCALGISAHHLPYHSRRVSMPLMRNAGTRKHTPVSLDTAMAEISKAIASRGKGELVAVLDERPGRTMSLVYRRALGTLQDAIYVTPPERERVTLTAIAGMLGEPDTKLGFDLERTGAVITFGAPILDGWGMPSEIIAARYRRESPMKVISVETKQSRTASLADMWLPILPGSESVMALAIANVLLADAKLPPAIDAAEYVALAAIYTPEHASRITGIPPETIIETARMLAAHAPAVAIGGGDPGGGPATRGEELAIAALNFVLGSVGVPGGIIAHEEPPFPKSWSEWKLAPHSRLEEVPDHSIAVLFLGDSPSGDAIPWTLIDRKLAPNHNLVVSLAPYVEGPARRANYILPSPAFLESVEELPTPPTATRASLSFAAQLLKPPTGAVTAAEVMAKISGVQFSMVDLIEERVAAIQEAKHGEVFSPDGSSKPVSEFKDAAALWTSLGAGAVWTTAPPAAKAPRSFRMATAEIQTQSSLPDDAAFPLVLLPYAWRGASGSGALPPLMTKVYQESLLRGSSDQCRIHPATAAQLSIRHGDRVVLETRCGSCEQKAWLDASVMPGVIEVPAGPQGATADSNILDVCGLDHECNWRASRARLRSLA